MAWTTIPDANLQPDKPARSVDALALRDNPVAIANGDEGAPRVLSGALNNAICGAGSNVCWFHPSGRAGTGQSTSLPYTSSTITYDVDRSIGARVFATGGIRCSLQHYNDGNAATSIVRILRNGSQVAEWSTTSTTPVTRTIDVSVSFGDLIVFQHRATGFNGFSAWQNLQISADRDIFLNSGLGA